MQLQNAMVCGEVFPDADGKDRRQKMRQQLWRKEVCAKKKQRWKDLAKDRTENNKTYKTCIRT